jgi:hypothetical protein
MFFFWGAHFTLENWKKFLIVRYVIKFILMTFSISACLLQLMNALSLLIFFILVLKGDRICYLFDNKHFVITCTFILFYFLFIPIHSNFSVLFIMFLFLCLLNVNDNFSSFLRVCRHQIYSIFLSLFLSLSRLTIKCAFMSHKLNC